MRRLTYSPAALIQRVLVSVAAVVFALALVRRFHQLGGPYFSIPETIQDHVTTVAHPSRDAIVLSRQAAERLPRGATVTVLMPSQAPDYDATLAYTAVGYMPHHKVVLPKLDAPLPDYVLSVREPLDHPAYRLEAEFPAGKIYARR